MNPLPDDPAESSSCANAGDVEENEQVLEIAEAILVDSSPELVAPAYVARSGVIEPPPLLDHYGNRKIHLFLLLISAITIILSFTLKATEGKTVMVPWIGLPLPETCASQIYFGMSCAGCGLTRSFIHIAHGNFAEAWRLQPIGYLWFAMIAFQIPFRIVQLYRINRGQAPIRLGLLGDLSWAVALAVLFLFWLARLSLGTLP